MQNLLTYLCLTLYSAAAVIIAAAAAVVVAIAASAAGKQDDEDDDYPEAAVAVSITKAHIYYLSPHIKISQPVAAVRCGLNWRGSFF